MKRLTTRAHVGVFALVLALLVWAPAASAASGSLQLKGGIDLPASETSGPVAGALFQGGGIFGFTLRAERIEVTSFVERSVKLMENSPSVRKGDVERATYAITDAVVGQAGSALDEHAFIGFYGADGAVIEASFPPQSRIRPSELSELKTGREVEDASHRPTFFHRVVGPHLLHEGPDASVRYVGDATIKLRGLPVDVQGRENATAERYYTGQRQSALAESTDAWIYLVATKAEIVVDRAPNATLAIRDFATVAWNGEARFHAVSGALRAGDDEHRASGRPASLDGNLDTEVRPRGGPFVQLRILDGEIHSSTLVRARVPSSPFSTGDSSLDVGLLLLATVVTGGGAALVVVRRRAARPAEPWTPEERRAFCLEYAAFAFDEGERDTTVACLRAARAVRDEADLAAWQALCHEQRGELESAMRVYDEAGRMTAPGNGWPEYDAARMAAAMHDVTRALRRLEACFRKDPLMANQVAADALAGGEADPFEILRGDPRLDVLIVRARLRHADRRQAPAP